MRKLVFTLLVILSFCNLGFAQKTIEPELLNVLNQKGDEMISVNIILKSQVNFDELQNRAKNINDKETRRNVLVNELKIFAEKEQQEILSILKAEEKSNEVSDINPRWMTNYINCTATRDVIYLLAEHPDVLIIGYNQEKYLALKVQLVYMLLKRGQMQKKLNSLMQVFVILVMFGVVVVA